MGDEDEEFMRRQQQKRQSQAPKVQPGKSVSSTPPAAAAAAPAANNSNNASSSSSSASSSSNSESNNNHHQHHDNHNNGNHNNGNSRPIQHQLSDANRMPVLGPFGVMPLRDYRITIFPDGYQIILEGSLVTLFEHDIVNFGSISPPTLITLGGLARRLANIPMKATHFCWAYPLASVCDLTRDQVNELPQNHELVTFCLYGGFMYLEEIRLPDGVRTEFKLLQVNAIGLGKGLFFSDPQTLARSSITTLERAGRFQPITVPALRAYGATKFCWVNPLENIGDGFARTDNGAFVYLYNDDYVQFFEVLGNPAVEEPTANVKQLFTDVKAVVFKPFDEVFARRAEAFRTQQEELTALTKQLEDHAARMRCKVCKLTDINRVFVPCGHIVMCKSCINTYFANNPRNCPHCSLAVTDLVDLFI